MNVFALDKRLLLFPVREIFLNFLCGSIHPAVKIEHGIIILANGGLVAGSLVMDKARGIKLLDPPSGLFKIRAVAGFISQRPDHDARAVLVAHHAALHTIEDRLAERRITRDVRHPLRSLFQLRTVEIRHAVALHIGLGNQIEAVLAAQLRQPRCVRVMAGADGVDVVLLHNAQVAERLLPGNRIACHRIAVVAVDAAEFDGHPIQQDNAAAHLNLPQADRLADPFVRRLDQQSIQNRAFGVPVNGVLHMERNGTICALLLFQQAPVQRGQRKADRNRIAAEIVIHPDLGAVRFQIQIRMDEEIADVAFRTAEQVHIAENTGHPQLILILQIAAVAPFEHQHNHCILAVVNEAGHIKFAGGMGNLAVSHKFPIDPDIKAGIDTLEIQICLCAGCPGNMERAPVRPAGVLLRHIRRIIRERVAGIGVLVAVIAVHLPHRRDRDLLPVHPCPITWE